MKEKSIQLLTGLIGALLFLYSAIGLYMVIDRDYYYEIPYVMNISKDLSSILLGIAISLFLISFGVKYLPIMIGVVFLFFGIVITINMWYLESLHVDTLKTNLTDTTENKYSHVTLDKNLERGEILIMTTLGFTMSILLFYTLFTVLFHTKFSQSVKNYVYQFLLFLVVLLIGVSCITNLLVYENSANNGKLYLSIINWAGFVLILVLFGIWLLLEYKK